MSITLTVVEQSGSEVLVGTGSTLQLTVQERVGGVVQAVAGNEITVLEQPAALNTVSVETGVSTASLTDLLLIRSDTEEYRSEAVASAAAARTSEVNADASEAATLAHKNAAALSETNAAGSAAAALANKNAAAASATAALAHKNAAAASETAAGNSAAAANNSKVAAAASETAAGNSAAAANNSKVAAATSEANALSHKNAADSSKTAAAASATAAATSEANALSHKNAADSSKAAAAVSATAAATSATSAANSEANALSHKNAADSSKTAAATSATAAATSEANALSHKNAADSSKTAAAASATAAATSEANALSHKNAADSSKAAATASATAAANSEANALSHKNAAGSSATAAAASATTAAASEANALSHKNAADSSKTAAAASAAQAQQYAAAVSSALIFRGGWSAAGGTYPTPSMNPETSDYYRITVGGTMTGAQGNITVTAGDYLHWDMTLDQWFKIDAVDAVTSVAGRTGDVTLTKTDVGLANVPNTDATNASNITSGTLAAARLPATINAATTGNAATATKLAATKNINGVAFDGSVDITIADGTKLPLAGGTLTGSVNMGNGIPTTAATLSANTPTWLGSVGTMGRANGAINSIKAFTGEGDYFANADRNPEYTVTSNYGDASILFNGNMADTITVPVANLATTPWVLTITRNATITATDVLYLSIIGHRLVSNGVKFTKWKVESLHAVGLTWVTVLERTGVNDDISTLAVALNITGGVAGAPNPNYHYTQGIRLTVSGATEATFSPGNLRIAAVQLRDWRPAMTPAQGLNALDTRGGSMFGDADWKYGTPRVAGSAVWHAGNDGSGSGLDADLLDGQQGSFYQDAGNITTGTLDKARLPVTINAATTGNAATATKLATARKINGVAFDGATDITVADDTKLPSGANAVSATKLATARTINGVKFDGTVDITIADNTKLPSGANAVSATKLATARTINGVAFDGTANITVADSTKLPLTGGVLTGGLCIGDGSAAKPNNYIVGDLEHYLEVRGTTATYPSALGVAFHHEGISTSALVHGQVNADMGYFNLRTDDPNLKVYFKDKEVWDSATGLRASKSAAGVTGNYTNWDSLTLHGVYKINSPDFVGDTSPPPSTYGYGILHTDVAEFGGEDRIMQIYYPHNYDFDQYFYQRMRNAGVWTGWAKIWRGGTGPNSGLVSSKVSDIAPTGEGRNLVEATMASNDFFRIRVYSSASDLGEVEIATADGGNEPIHVRQYTGFFANVARTLTLLDSYGNTIIPGITYGSSFTVAGNSGGLHEGNGDSATSTVNNVKIASWFGIGFSPSISGQPVPYGEYSHWFNTRNGDTSCRGYVYAGNGRLKDVAVLSGEIGHGGTLPIPNGFSEGQCAFFVSPRDTNSSGYNWDLREGLSAQHYRIICYPAGRVAQGYTRIYNDVNDSYEDRGFNMSYLVIGVK